jgi:hypothetical protein
MFKSKHSGWTWDLKRTPFTGGGGGGGQPSTPAATSQTQTVSSIAPWAQPGVSNLINQQMANMFPNATTNADGSVNLGQQKGYTAFGQNGAGIGPNQMAAAQSAVAGFSPLQQMAQQGVGSMTMPGQFGTASVMAQNAGQGMLNTVNPAMGYGSLGAGYGQSGANIGTQGGLGYGQMGAGIGQQAAGQAGNAINIGQQGMGYGNAAAGLAGNAMGYGQAGANIGTAGGLGYGAAGMQAGQAGAGYGAMGAQQGASYGQNAQNAQAVQGYMNPYLQATLNPALQLQQQQFGQINAQNQGQATQQGAFGGGRQAVTQGLNQQNQMLAQNQLTGQAYNQAYNTANQNMQNAASLGMQGAGLGIQGQNAAMQGAGLGLQGVNAAMAGQQLGLSGVNAANQAYQTGIQGANTGLAGMNAANALYNTGIAGANTGLQGVNTALAGTAQGMQGAQVGLQGVNAAQAGYTGAGQQAANLANIGGQQQAAQLNMYNAQNQMGAQQQANQQAVINQAISNYANTQNYPMQQSYNLEGLYTGAPTAQTQTQYAAPPSTVNTAANAALGTYAASKLVAKGGIIKAKKMVKGGIAKYDVGGAVESDLYNMDDAHLAQEAKTSPSMEIRKDAAKIMAERQMENQAMSRGVGAATGGMQMAGGGIVAFAEGGSYWEKMKETLGKATEDTTTVPESLKKPFGINLFGATDKNSLIAAKEEPKDTTKKDTGVTFDKTAGGNPAVAALDKGLGDTVQARPAAGPAPTTQAPIDALSNVDKYIADLQAKGFGLPTEERKAEREQLKLDREEAKAQKKEDFNMGLLAAAGKGMSATSPFANVGIGQMMQGVGEGAAYANKNYNEAIKMVQAGQLDLNKLDSADRTNLLHYAVTGAVSDANTRTKMAELAEIAKTRAAGSGQASLARQDAAITARAKLILGNNPMPTPEDVQNAIDIATQQVSGKSVAGALPKGVVVKKVG